MPDNLRDLITRTLLANGTVTCAARADAILAALDAAGWTIVKRDICGGCRGLGGHRPTCPTQPGWRWRETADAAESIGDRIGAHDTRLANEAYALTHDLRALWYAAQQTPATPNLDSIPAGEADTPTEGETGSQQQEEM